MVKIFRYECKRLLWNKFFFGILAVTLFYGWQVLTGASILGVSHTAPFSPWTFGDYLSRLLPLLWIGVLFFLTFFTSGAERRAAVLTAATPVRPWQYALARLGAALTGTVLQSLAVLLLSAVFYARMFRWYSWGSLFLPAAISLIPALVFSLGSGWLLGRLRPWLVYLWMPLPFLLQLLPLPELLSLWNGRFFSQYPLSLGTLDPAFFPARGHVPGPIRAPGCGRGPADRRPAPPFPWRVSHLPHSKIFCLGAPFSGASPSPQCPLTFFLQSFMIDVVARVWRNWQTRWI